MKCSVEETPFQYLPVNFFFCLQGVLLFAVPSNTPFHLKTQSCGQLFVLFFLPTNAFVYFGNLRHLLCYYSTYL